MNWSDKAYLLSKNKYNENSVIAEVYTKYHGKVSGIIFGATSKKNKNYLQIGNKLHINYLSKNNNKLGSFKIEIDKILTPFFFDNQKKLACIISSMTMVKLLTVELQENLNIYKSLDNLFNILNDDTWLKNYILWELNFFKLIGYDLSLKDIISVDHEKGEKIYYVKSKNIKKIIPNFLIETNLNPKNNLDLINGLKLASDYLEKSILRPNNINYPKSRLAFIELLK